MSRYQFDVDKMQTLQNSMKSKNDHNMNHSMKQCNENHNMTSNDLINIKHHNMNHSMTLVSKQEYAKMVTQLEEWSVYAPKKVVRQYTPLKVQEAINRTQFKKPNNPGAYFRMVVKSLAS